MTEEQRVERDGFGESHADDALHEDLRGGARIAADGFSGFEADEAYADRGAEAAETALNGAGDFSEEVNHVMCLSLVGWITGVRAQGTVPTGKGLGSQWAASLCVS